MHEHRSHLAPKEFIEKYTNTTHVFHSQIIYEEICKYKLCNTRTCNTQLVYFTRIEHIEKYT